MAKIRVLVAEDSISVRKHLVELLDAHPELEVVGEAEDGERAIELCARLRPDVITLDMMMPRLDGLAVTEHVMAYHPTPILIVSSSFNRGEVFKTYEALAAGAMDVLEKPTGDGFAPEWEAQLYARLKLLARIKVITHPRAKLGGPRLGPRPPIAPGEGGPWRLVLLGTSTGGPNAVLEILRGLPADFPLPLLLVLHISRGFGAAFAQWLNENSPLPVRFARDLEPLPKAGQRGVWVAPPDHHLVVEAGRLRLDGGPERHSCRPSVDALFASVAREQGAHAIACLLTGMGRDGAEGLLALRRAGAMTIAQDEASSVVFGMPKEGIRLGAACRVLPLDAIAPALLAFAATRGAP